MADAPGRAAEIAAEQRHVDRVYERLDELRDETVAATRAGYGMAAAGTLGALVDRDAMVYQLSRRLRALDAEYEGLVFGRLDLDTSGTDGDGPTDTLHIGRLGLRDERYRPLVVDWRAPAAAAFYRATPREPMGVQRRRVIRCTGQRVVDVQDDLLDPAGAPAGMTVVGEGALLASLARATGERMRDIVATIAREQDLAVRAPGSGAALITGGPGTGKTAVALHRAAYLLYSDRNRYESRGVLIVGPSPVFMRYIERVLPGLGEESVTLRPLGELVDGLSADRHDEPVLAAVKGSLRMRQVLRRAVRDAPPEAPDTLRIVYAGLVLRLDSAELSAVRRAVHRHGSTPNRARRHARAELIEALWQVAVRVGGDDYAFDRDGFADEIDGRDEFDAFVARWWPMLTPVEVLGWLGDEARLRRYAGRSVARADVPALAGSFRGPLSVSDVALADELRVLLGEPPAPRRVPAVDDDELRELTVGADRQVPVSQAAAELDEDFDEVEDWAAAVFERAAALGSDRGPERLAERPPNYDEYAHVVVDEAQDLSPMQWRMLGRRARFASWTIVGDPAQSAWPDPDEADRAREQALGRARRHEFELATNYRNSAEIFQLAAAVARAAEPGLRLPTAVRRTGAGPRIRPLAAAGLATACRDELAGLLAAVDGTIGVVGPDELAAELGGWLADRPERVALLEPLATKGMEYDAVLVVEPARIAATAAGGHRTLYVVLTRATQRLTVLTTDPAWPPASAS